MSTISSPSDVRDEALPGGLVAYLVALPFLLLFARGLADATVVLTGFAFLWRSFGRRDWQWARQSWFLAVLALVGYLLLSAPFAFDAKTSLIYTLGFLRWPLFAMALAVWVFRQPRALGLFGLSTLIAISFIVFDCLWQLYFGTDIFGFEKFDNFRLTGPLRDNPIPGNLTLRLFFVALFSFACVLYTRGAARGARVTVDGVCLLLVLYCLFQYATGERMSFLLYVSATVMVIAGLWLQFRQHRRRLLLWLAALGLSFALFTWFEPQLYARSVASMVEALTAFSSNDYASVFSSGYEVWKTNWFSGVGLGNYAEYCDAVIREPGHNACQRHPHNMYLHWLAVGGVSGTLGFIVVLILLSQQIFSGLYRAKNGFLMACCIATLFVTFWPVASSSSFFNNWFGAVVWCGIGWLLAISRITAEGEKARAFFMNSGSRDGQLPESFWSNSANEAQGEAART